MNFLCLTICVNTDGFDMLQYFDPHEISPWRTQVLVSRLRHTNGPPESPPHGVPKYEILNLSFCNWVSTVCELNADSENGNTFIFMWWRYCVTRYNVFTYGRWSYSPTLFLPFFRDFRWDITQSCFRRSNLDPKVLVHLAEFVIFIRASFKRLSIRIWL